MVNGIYLFIYLICIRLSLALYVVDVVRRSVCRLSVCLSVCNVRALVVVVLLMLSKTNTVPAWWKGL